MNEVDEVSLCSLIVTSDSLSESEKAVQSVMLCPYDIPINRCCYNFTMNSLRISRPTLEELKDHRGNMAAILDYAVTTCGCSVQDILNTLGYNDLMIQGMLCSNKFIHRMITVINESDDITRDQFINSIRNTLKKIGCVTGIVCVRNLLRNICVLENELGMHVSLRTLENLRSIIVSNCEECIQEYNEFMLIRLRCNHIPSYL